MTELRENQSVRTEVIATRECGALPPDERVYYLATVSASLEQLLEETSAPTGYSLQGRLAVGISGYLDYVRCHADWFQHLLGTGAGRDPAVSSLIEATRTALIERFLRATEDESPEMRTAIRGWLALAQEGALEWLRNRDLVSLDTLYVVLHDTACSAVAAVRLPNGPVPGCDEEPGG